LQRERCFPDHLVDAGAAHCPVEPARLVIARQFDDNREALFAGSVACEVGHVVTELDPGGQPADGVDAPECMLHLDLRHYHRREIDQSGEFGRGHLPRLSPEHAQRA
jgi:hypothetical protein